jgi:hypothetical protein
MKQEYSYDGPVLEFGRCITVRWTASTCAESEKKARSNLTYRYKKQFNKVANTRIDLPGKLVAVE